MPIKKCFYLIYYKLVRQNYHVKIVFKYPKEDIDSFLFRSLRFPVKVPILKLEPGVFDLAPIMHWETFDPLQRRSRAAVKLSLVQAC